MICGKITFNLPKNVPEATAPGRRNLAAGRRQPIEPGRFSDKVNFWGDGFVSRRHNLDFLKVKVNFP
jgi:hypothetical protein